MPSNISLASILEKLLVTELGHAGSRIHKISLTLSNVIGDGGGGRGGGGHSNSAFYSVKLCVKIPTQCALLKFCCSFVLHI